MALLKNPMARVVNNSSPNRIDLVCEVKVEFSALDRGILQNVPNAPVFTVEVFVREIDGVPEPGPAPMNAFLASFDVSLSMGNPDAVIQLTRTFTRGTFLDEDPFPFPNDEDEIQVYFGLVNNFTKAQMQFVTAPVVKGRF